jgi:hypothetical protein
MFELSVCIPDLLERVGVSDRHLELALDRHELGVAGSFVGEADDLITHLELLDPSPTSSTTPARSLPCPEGNVAGQRSCMRRSQIAASPGLIPAAFTLTSTCLTPGTGRSTSTTLRTSTPP